MKTVTLETASRYAKYLKLDMVDLEEYRARMEAALNNGCETVMAAARKAAG
jgi:hypothetical protein